MNSLGSLMVMSGGLVYSDLVDPLLKKSNTIKKKKLTSVSMATAPGCISEVPLHLTVHILSTTHGGPISPRQCTAEAKLLWRAGKESERDL